MVAREPRKSTTAVRAGGRIDPSVVRFGTAAARSHILIQALHQQGCLLLDSQQSPISHPADEARQICRPFSPCAPVCLLRWTRRDAQVQTHHHLGWAFDAGIRVLRPLDAVFGVASDVAGRDTSLYASVLLLYVIGAGLKDGRLRSLSARPDLKPTRLPRGRSSGDAATEKLDELPGYQVETFYSPSGRWAAITST